MLLWVFVALYDLLYISLLVFSIKPMNALAWFSLAFAFLFILLFIGYDALRRRWEKLLFFSCVIVFVIAVYLLLPSDEIIGPPFWIFSVALLMILWAIFTYKTMPKERKLDSEFLADVLILVFPMITLPMIIVFCSDWKTRGIVDIATLFGYLMSNWRLTARAFSGIGILLMIYLAPKLYKAEKQEFVVYEAEKYITLDKPLAKLYGLDKTRIRTNIQIDRLYRAIKTLDTMITGHRHFSYRKHYWSLANLMTLYGDKNLNAVFRRYWSYPQSKHLPFLRFAILGPTIGLGGLWGLSALIVYLLAVDTLFAVVTGGSVEASYWMIVAKAPITYAPLIALAIYFLGSYVAGWYYLRKIRGSEYLMRKAGELMNALVGVLKEVLPFRLRIILAGAYERLKIVDRVVLGDAQLGIAEF